jgi:hypothetical protein
MPDVLTQKIIYQRHSLSPIDFGQAITQAISLVLLEVQFNRNTITQYRDLDYVRRILNGKTRYQI